MSNLTHGHGHAPVEKKELIEKDIRERSFVPELLKVKLVEVLVVPATVLVNEPLVMVRAVLAAPRLQLLVGVLELRATLVPVPTVPTLTTKSAELTLVSWQPLFSRRIERVLLGADALLAVVLPPSR